MKIEANYSIFISSVALADLLFCLPHVVLEAVFIFNHYLIHTEVGWRVCNALIFSGYIFCSGMLMSLSLVAFNRYSALYHSADYHDSLFKRNKCRLMCFGAFVPGILCCIIMSTVTRDDDPIVCMPVFAENDLYYYINLALDACCISSTGLGVYFLYKIFKKLQQRKNLKLGMTEKSIMKRNTELMRGISCQMLSTLCLNTPIMFVGLFPFYFHRWAKYVALDLTLLSTSFDAVITVCMLKDYRLPVLKRWRKIRGLPEPTENKWANATQNKKTNPGDKD